MAVTLKGTWKIECDKLRLSNLGVGAPFTGDGREGIRVTIDRDLGSAGLEGTQRVLLPEWSNDSPLSLERKYAFGE